MLEDVSLDESPPSPLSHPETNELASSDLQLPSLKTEVVAEEFQNEESIQMKETQEPEQPEQAIESPAQAFEEPAHELDKAIDEPETIIEAVEPPLPLDESEEVPFFGADSRPPPPPQEYEMVIDLPTKQEIDDVSRPESPSASKSVAFDPSVQDPKGGRLGKRDKKSEKVKAAKAQAVKDEKKAKDDVQKEKERAKRKASGEKTKVIKNTKGQIVVITEKKVAPMPERKEIIPGDVKSSPSKGSMKADKKSKGKERKDEKRDGIEDKEEKRGDRPLKGVLKEPTPFFDDKPNVLICNEAAMAATEQASLEDHVMPEHVNNPEAIGDGTSNPFLCAARERAAELRSRARSWRIPAHKSGCKVENWRQSVPLYSAVENLSRNSLALSTGSLPED